jgi:hypothetical protein
VQHNESIRLGTQCGDGRGPRASCAVGPERQGKSANSLKGGERGRNRTFNLLIKSQLLCQLSYAPISGWSFSPKDSLIVSRADGLRRQPGSGLPEPLNQRTANTSRILSQAIARTPPLPGPRLRRGAVNTF